ncbi:uncharacterized protein BX664DRAFT_269574 [Halteromyces radiatus]|uniref:uncharacterized protein n=1 Tax=Halteromyces radiatus TaxID=101107 RepID=UPI00221FBCFA|nr:uncharacterized protein BX664DRAFT_269574 [Halteromyces radiatus]KAI8080042.1 hypothetical protein BX664DRAFT_269574 [Halteromyces radiatus]
MKEELKDIIGKHIVYTYGDLGKYEAYYQSEDVVVYAIHGGPMKGRYNYVKAYYQKIRDNLFNVSWVEETGTIVTTTVDLDQKRVHGFIAFSQGHWENNEDAHGDKRNMKDLERWRKLSKIGDHTTRHIHLDEAHIIDIFEGPGDLKQVTNDMLFF